MKVHNKAFPKQITSLLVVAISSDFKAEADSDAVFSAMHKKSIMPSEFNGLYRDTIWALIIVNLPESVRAVIDDKNVKPDTIVENTPNKHGIDQTREQWRGTVRKRLERYRNCYTTWLAGAGMEESDKGLVARNPNRVDPKPEQTRADQNVIGLRAAFKIHNRHAKGKTTFHVNAAMAMQKYLDVCVAGDGKCKTEYNKLCAPKATKK